VRGPVDGPRSSLLPIPHMGGQVPAAFTVVNHSSNYDFCVWLNTIYLHNLLSVINVKGREDRASPYYARSPRLVGGSSFWSDIHSIPANSLLTWLTRWVAGAAFETLFGVPSGRGGGRCFHLVHPPWTCCNALLLLIGRGVTTKSTNIK